MVPDGLETIKTTTKCICRLSRYVRTRQAYRIGNHAPRKLTHLHGAEWYKWGDVATGWETRNMFRISVGWVRNEQHERWRWLRKTGGGGKVRGGPKNKVWHVYWSQWRGNWRHFRKRLIIFDTIRANLKKAVFRSRHALRKSRKGNSAEDLHE